MLPHRLPMNGIQPTGKARLAVGKCRKKMSYMIGKGMLKKVPGLTHFYMYGQWIEPAGNVELSCASGRDVIKDI